MFESKIAPTLKRAANQGTKLLSMLAGDYFPFYYVVEYPRSGGTWVAHLLADYLQIPLPKHSLAPIACRAVLHSHWKYDRRLRSPVYVLRDGRDVAVSMMFYALRRIETQHYYAKRFPSLFQIQNKNYAEALPRFLIEWFEHPAGCRFSWPRHVRDWAFQPGVHVVRYEDFNRNPLSAFGDLLAKLKVDGVDEKLLAISVEKYSFQRQTKREAGREDQRSNKRKGIVGDWKNYFNTEAAEIFERYSAGLLVDLGYESDKEWVKKLHNETKR
ncbi:hypothetical protein DRI50_06105 [candidate division KSB1 bacterium]|nr:MAG: hypothetical protein DRI50_06105 [candidate division KSB1 bacterium]